jgi:hypothetical protein
MYMHRASRWLQPMDVQCMYTGEIRTPKEKILKVISDSGLGCNNFRETTFHNMFRHREL